MGKNDEIVALEGKTFEVNLQSMMGSANYGWCITDLPKGVIFMGSYMEPVRRGTAPVVQHFCFGAVSAQEIQVEIGFGLFCLSDIHIMTQSYTATIRIVPCNSGDFVPSDENAKEAADPAIPYGYTYQASVMKYGYPCGVQDANLKYGYPCGVQDASLKYGYPCGVQDASLKYGYPCGEQDASLKYGYPCMETMKDARPYGYPY